MGFVGGWGFPGGAVVKNLPANAGGTRDVLLIPGLGGPPEEKRLQPAPVFLLEKSHGQKSLVGYSPQGHKESDMTEQLSTGITILG